MSTQLTLTAESDRALIDSALPTERFLEIALQAPTQESRAERAPVNIALILDRSGSMAGAKLDYARRAACHVLDLLSERDQAAVVFYDDEVSVLSPSQPVDAPRREEMKRGIRRLREGNSTNLGGGWLRGAQEVAEHLLEEGVNRALLLTDGLANVGIVDPHQLAIHARELRQRRVSTSTFGVGLDFNEYLLETMADLGGGRFHFISDPERIPAIFAEELGELLTVTAREVMLRVHVPPAVNLELLGQIPHQKTPELLTVPVGDLSSGQSQSLYLKLLTPAGKAGERIELLIEASYAGSDNAAGTARAKAVLTYAPTAEVDSAARNRKVEESAAEVTLAGEMGIALVMERAGNRAGAAKHMRQHLSMNMAFAPAQVSEEIGCFADSLEEGLTEEARKTTHANAYSIRRKRS